MLVLAWAWLDISFSFVGRANDKERHHLNAIVSDDEVRNCVLHTRQDLKLVCFLLGGILIMLGIVADRLH